MIEGLSQAADSDAGGFGLAVGDVPLRVHCSDALWRRQMASRYGEFMARFDASRLAVRPLHVDYRVEGEGAPSPQDLCRGRLAGLRSRCVGSSGDVELSGDGFVARWRRSEGRIEVRGPRAAYPLDLLLQAVWYDGHQQALIVHAAALSDGTSGWLCAGPSGSGKSTLAGLFPRRAMADELVGVSFDSGRPELVALPFWTGRPGRVPLRAVCCLRHRQSVPSPQGGAHLRRRLVSTEALQRLRHQIAWPTWDAAAMGRCLDALAQLLATVPVYELAFSPSTCVWSQLSGGEEFEA